MAPTATKHLNRLSRKGQYSSYIPLRLVPAAVCCGFILYEVLPIVLWWVIRTNMMDTEGQGFHCSHQGALLTTSMASLQVSGTKGIRIPSMYHKDVRDQWGLDVHVPRGNGQNYVNNCMRQILGYKSIYLSAFSISSLAGSSFSACMKAGIASLYFCAHKETPQEWDTGVWDQVTRLDLMHLLTA